MPPLGATSTQVDTASSGANSITATLPGNLSAGHFLVAALTIETAADSSCTMAGLPFACCTGAGTGICAQAGTATIVAPSNAACTGSGTPNSCCTGNGTGTCNWTLVGNSICGSDLQVSIYGKLVQAGESSTTNYTWNFTVAGNPSAFLGVLGLIGISNVGSTPVQAVTHQCNLNSTVLSAPSVTTSRNNALNLLVYSIVGDNSITRPGGYSLLYQHSISGSGPDVQADEMSIKTPGATGNQGATASAANDNVAFQLAVSPLP